jgi:predicted RNA methylase
VSIPNADKFYTPLDVVRKMIALAGNIRPLYVADFTAGNGDLLSVAQEKWGGSQIIAADICNASVNRLRRKQPSWKVTECDFLMPESRARSRILRKIQGRVSLILLNPPFSCRGGTRRKLVIDGKAITCSTALAFILTAVSYLSNEGQLIAVLPAGSPASEKDAVVWDILKRSGQVDILGRNGHRTFVGCFAKTVIMRFQKGTLSTVHKVEEQFQEGDNKCRREKKISIRIVRGTVQMHSLNDTPMEQTLPLIHSTELNEHTIDLTRRRADARHRSVKGPCLLIPRVGKPKKLAIYNSAVPVILSDCVIALNCKTSAEMKKAKTILEHNWPQVVAAYNGTCAAFITINNISHVLRDLGFQVINPFEKSHN